MEDNTQCTSLELAEKILKILQLSEIDFTKRLSRNTLSILELELGVERSKISKSLSYYKRVNDIQTVHYNISNKPKVISTYPKRLRTPPTIDFQNICIENNLFRKNPSKEILACRTMSNTLVRRLPIGGTGLLIGTPAAFCASTTDTNKLFLVDNLEVAMALRMTTDEIPSIIVGNIIDPKKAEIKAQHWRSNNGTNDFKISVEPVDRNSYAYHWHKQMI